MGSSSSKSRLRAPRSQLIPDKNVDLPSPASCRDNDSSVIRPSPLPSVEKPDPVLYAYPVHKDSKKKYGFEAFSKQRNVKPSIVEVKPLNVIESLQNPQFVFPAEQEKVKVNAHQQKKLLLKPLVPGRLGLGALDIKTKLVQDGILDRAAITQYQSEDIIRDLQQTGIISKRSEKCDVAQGEPARFVRLAPLSGMKESKSINTENSTSEVDEVCASREGAVCPDVYPKEYSPLSIANKMRDVELM